MIRRRTAGTRTTGRALLLVLSLLGAMAMTSPAAAHLGVTATDPPDGGRLSRAPQQITLTFTKAAAPVRSGFRLVDGNGRRIAATVNSPDGGITWRVRPVQPLTSDRYRLTWKVVAADAHAKSGSVSFEVALPAKASPTLPGTPAPSATPAPGHPIEADHEVTAGSPMASGRSPTSGYAMDPSPDSDAAPAALGVLAAAARWLAIVGVLIAVGALVVTVTTLVGSPGDVALATRVVRSAALAAVAGSVGECLSLLMTLGSAAPAGATAASLARLLGGAVLAVSATITPRRAGGRRSYDVRALPPEPVSTGHGGLQLLLAPPVRTERVRAVLAHPVAAGVGTASAIGSFLLDGHTASTGPRWAMLPADAAHTVGAAVWAGGVVLLACLLLVRARAGVPTGAGELAVRFSVPASAAAAAVGAAGAVMLLLITDRPADLLSTPWGRVMAAKLALVGVVTLLGYANNRYAVPALDAWQPHTARTLRRTVAVEASVMVVVLLVTAILVTSGT